MPKVTPAVVAALAVVLVLAGCADEQAVQNASSERNSTASGTEQGTPEPLAAETREPTETEGSEADAAFLQYVHDELPPNTMIGDASDAQLITAGHEGCEQAAAGVPWESIRLVEGEEPTPTGYYMDTSALLNGALYNYCPDLIPAVG